jgi:molecular chaperone DnaK
MITPLVDRSFKVTQDALALARLSPTSFDKVILVGGSTRMPLVRQRVEAFFGQQALDRVNPDEVVAIGAAIQAAALTEGARRRSIPAPPGVIGKPRTLPGVQNEGADNTQTSTVDPSAMAKPGAAFASAPPAFNFHPASAPPPQARGSAPPMPPSSRPNKLTTQGIAPPPQTKPMGARPAAAPAPPPGHDDDPSIASFPDLAVPTPFEWFPSSGQPASGASARGAGPRSGPAGSERSFGGNTITATGASPQSPGPQSPGPQGPGFGAIDEPPSIMSTPSASVPSFPSMPGPSSPGMPSPIGEPDGFGVPDGQFGAVRDLSLISTTGIAIAAVSSAASGKPGAASGELGFGHVADLSLVSSTSATAGLDGVAEARQKMLEDLEEQTQANVFEPQGGGLSLEARGGPGGRGPAPPQGAGSEEDGADLPSVAAPTDLPSVVGGRAKRPEIRKPGQPGMTATGGASMLGKPPPLLAPQPFGPMVKMGADQAPPSRTAVLPAQPPKPPPARPSAPPPQAAPPRTAAMPARAPLNTTAPLNQGAVVDNTSVLAPDHRGQGGRPGQPPPIPAAAQAPFAGGGQTQGFGSAGSFGGPPPQQGFGSVPPPQQGFGGPPPQQGFGSVPPPQQGFGGPPPQQGFGGPPPQQGFGGPPPQQGYGAPGASQPPQAYGASAPGASQPPPIFGAFPSAPPPEAPLDLNAMAYEPNTSAMAGAPGMPPGMGFAAPVLVDVTPRGLVVETAGGYTDTIIPRNSKIPCERTRRFATGRDMQTTVRVRVGQGESPAFPQNTFLGEVELSGLRAAPRGEVVVAVTFEVDADGILRIRARDVQTGQEARATLQLIGVADESSVVMMINRFAQQPVVGGTSD